MPVEVIPTGGLGGIDDMVNRACVFHPLNPLGSNFSLNSEGKLRATGACLPFPKTNTSLINGELEAIASSSVAGSNFFPVINVI
jgi:hypothetical protein